jgi:glc operon protein GlcG
MATLTDKKTLNLEAAREIAAAAEAEARKNGWNVSIAILDDGGHLLHYLRMDEAPLGSVNVSQAKARSALLFKRPTKVFSETVAGGRVNMLALPGAIPVEGGVPLLAGGKVVGSIGVSGVTSEQDGEVAAAGAAVLG